MMAFPRIRQRDNLPKNWLVTSFSSKPLLLARADPRSLTWARAPEWKPPKELVKLIRLIRFIRLDLQWRGCLQSYMWMDGMGLGRMDGMVIVGSLRAPSVLIKVKEVK